MISCYNLLYYTVASMQALIYDKLHIVIISASKPMVNSKLGE